MKLKPVAMSVSLMVASIYAPAASAVDLSHYTLDGRYNLPRSTTASNRLADEVSAVTWNRDTNTLFMVGDGSTAIVQTSLTGVLINSMSLGLTPGNPQGTSYYDTEGLAYIGNNSFVLVEERYRRASLFNYTAGTTLGYAGSQHVTLGTTTGNNGLEGIAFDPPTTSTLPGSAPGFVAVKENGPMGVFQTNISFAAGSATNGSAITNATNLFNADVKLAGQVVDIADVFALSNINGIGAIDRSNLLLLSQNSGKVLEVDRNGNVLSALAIPYLPTSPLGSTVLSGVGSVSVEDQGHEGMTMDDAGNLYIVSENGGGDSTYPQLWVFKATLAPVPEPENYAMLLAGLGLIGMIKRCGKNWR